MSIDSSLPSFVLVDQDSLVRLVRPVSPNLMDHLPAKVYKIDFDKDGPLLAPFCGNFTLPEKIYGEQHHELLDLIVNDYKKTQGALGAAFIGTKGGGKTLLCEAICNKTLQMDVPVVVVDRPVTASFLKALAHSVGPVVFLFDEFSKIYATSFDENRENQENLLTLFSDSGLKKVLFLVADNSIEEINRYFLDRPGRLKYFVEYAQNTAAIFREAAEGFPIHAEVMEYLEFYFSTSAAQQLGLDAILTIRDAAVNETTHEGLFRKLRYLNVPAPSIPRFQIIGVRKKGEAAELYYEVKVDKDGYSAIVEIEDGKTTHQYKAGDSRQAKRGWKDLDETFSIFIETSTAWNCWKGLFAKDDIPKFLGWEGNEKLQSHNDEFGSVTLSNIRREDDRPIWRPQGPRGPGSMPGRGALPSAVTLDDTWTAGSSPSVFRASKHIVNPDPSLILPSSGISDTTSIPD